MQGVTVLPVMEGPLGQRSHHIVVHQKLLNKKKQTLTIVQASTLSPLVVIAAMQKSSIESQEDARSMSGEDAG